MKPLLIASVVTGLTAAAGTVLINTPRIIAQSDNTPAPVVSAPKVTTPPAPVTTTVKDTEGYSYTFKKEDLTVKTNHIEGYNGCKDAWSDTCKITGSYTTKVVYANGVKTSLDGKTQHLSTYKICESTPQRADHYQVWVDVIQQKYVWEVYENGSRGSGTPVDVARIGWMPMEQYEHKVTEKGTTRIDSFDYKFINFEINETYNESDNVVCGAAYNLGLL